MTKVERKTLSPLSRRSSRAKISENLRTRQHSLRSCRITEPSYKIIRDQTKRRNSKISLNSSTSSTLSMITCANISLQRKLYKQILIAESDGNFILNCVCLVCLYVLSFYMVCFSRRLWSFSWFTNCLSRRFNWRIHG